MCNIVPYDTDTRVCAGELGQVARSGGGHRYTLRDRLEERREADVMVDARAFLVHNILKYELICSYLARSAVYKHNLLMTN